MMRWSNMRFYKFIYGFYSIIENTYALWWCSFLLFNMKLITCISANMIIFAHVNSIVSFSVNRDFSILQMYVMPPVGSFAFFAIFTSSSITLSSYLSVWNYQCKA
jgi:hypothetical protein